MSPAGGGRGAVRVCGATTGFFVLQRCETRARTGCSRCTRSVCAHHTHALPGDPAPVCPECYAAARGYVGDPNDPAWTVGYRRTFYWEIASTSGDDTWWLQFDETDREGFDQDESDPGEWVEGEWVEGEGANEGEGEFGDDLDDDSFVDS